MDQLQEEMFELRMAMQGCHKKKRIAVDSDSPSPSPPPLESSIFKSILTAGYLDQNKRQCKQDLEAVVKELPSD